MTWKNFVVGGIYTNQTWIISKLDSKYYVVICPGQDTNKPRGHIGEGVMLRDVYDVMRFEDLTPTDQVFYHKTFPTVKACTCEIMTLMANGCQCGWLKVERSQNK